MTHPIIQPAQLSWPLLAEGWLLTRRAFLGADTAKLPEFEPLDRQYHLYRFASTDPLARMPLPGHPGYEVALLKAAPKWHAGGARKAAALTVVLLCRGEKVGFVERLEVGTDVLSIQPAHQGRGLSPALVLAAMALRARHRVFAPAESLEKGMHYLFHGGCYSDAGLASCGKAHALAVQRAIKAGRAVPAEVLADYPALSLAQPAPETPGTGRRPRL